MTPFMTLFDPNKSAFIHRKPMLDPNEVARVKLELYQGKTIEQIHLETAMTWLARAIAAFQLFSETRVVRYLRDAEHFAHESLEHAALSDHGSSVVGYVETNLVPLRRNLGK